VSRQREEAGMIDISVAIGPGLPVWPGDRGFSCGWIARREDDSSVNLAALTFSAHAGTHADAPLHVESAWPASEALPAAVFVGPCDVVRLPHGFPAGGAVDVPTLSALLGSRLVERVLLCTGHSVASGTFPDAWPVLHERSAQWLVERGVRLFGTDAPSVDARESKTLPVHHTLFGGGAFVLENLSLAGVAPGRYELLAAPLHVIGADAAPVRALLRRDR
jgi:arylformamidase